MLAVTLVAELKSAGCRGTERKVWGREGTYYVALEVLQAGLEVDGA